jgi:hypothetical protein
VIKLELPTKTNLDDDYFPSKNKNNIQKKEYVIENTFITNIKHNG